MIKIDNLEKNYKGFSLSISMEITPGRVTGIVGRNGAGKSTTIKAILGLISPDNGSVSVFGTEATRLSKKEKSQIGVALADSGFSTYLTLNDVIAIMKNMYREFDAKAFREECKRQKLPFDKKIKDFSTGMKAKLRVLVAMSHEAQLLILDEPTAGLDVLARNEILDMLRDYLAKDATRSLLISSHISSDLEGLCDDIYMINEGKIILHEDTDQILSNYAVIKVDDATFEKLDQKYLLKTKKEAFGYCCLTNEKGYYVENYPNIIVENGNIDDLIIMMNA